MSSKELQECVEESKCSSVSYQLTHSLVEPFKPRIDSRILDLNVCQIETYVCRQCCDTFLFESSLKSHLDRKSIKISYFCDKCKTNICFYNRCALLSHIRQHNQNNELQVSQVFVSPLPLTQLLPEGMTTNRTLVYKKSINSIDNINCNSTKDKKTCIESIHENKTIETIKSNSNSNNVSSIKTIKSSENSVKNTLNTEQNNTNDINDSKETKDISNNLIKKKILIKTSTDSDIECSECKISLSSELIREQHFVRNDEMVLPSNQCKLCPLICPTKCSQSVHNRLHNNTSHNRICPECGAKFDQMSDTDFKNHIIINCLHFSRRLVYRCIYCSNKMSTLSSFIQHIKSLHTKQYFQCCQCLFKFESDVKLKEHQTNSHPNDLRRVLIFKCPICENELKTCNTYFEHIANHQKKLCGFANFVFACYECNQSFVNKNDLKLHFNSFHTQNKNQFEKNTFFSKLAKDISLQFGLNVGNVCESYANQKLNNQINNNNSIVNSNGEKRVMSDLNGDGLNINGPQVKKQMTDKESDVRDVKEDESNVKPTNSKLYKCKECGLTFPFLQTLKRHLILEHRIHDVESYINKINVQIPFVITEPQLPKEDGERKLSEILDNEDSTDTMCPICSLKFSDSKELRIHGRVHGMAFIKSCQKKTT